MQQARTNGAEQEVMEIINGVPDQESATIADVMKASAARNDSRENASWQTN